MDTPHAQHLQVRTGAGLEEHINIRDVCSESSDARSPQSSSTPASLDEQVNDLTVMLSKTEKLRTEFVQVGAQLFCYWSYDLGPIYDTSINRLRQ